MKNDILWSLSPVFPWKGQLQYFPAVDSTNDLLKKWAKADASHGTAIVAGSQTGGHGRMGRSFHSPEGMGLYLSVLLRPECPPADLMHLTCAVAVAACDAVEAAAGFRPGIKWTNDLVFGKQKLGGILTEMGLSSDGTVDWCIIGIGINCHQRPEDFPEEIRSIAASLDMVTGKKTNPALLAARLLEALANMDVILMAEKEAIMERYRTDCVTIGKEVSVVRGDEIRHGRALDVDPDGALVVEYDDGTVASVNAGEVSIRGMYGYL